MPGPKTSLSWRIFAANASVLCVAAAVLLLSPVTVSHPVSAHEAAAVAGGLCVMVILNLWIVRRTLAPLTRLADDMDCIDMLQDGEPPVIRPSSGDLEILRLTTSYQSMHERLRLERRQSARRTALAQEEERRHVARELHDQVGQVLTGLVLQLDDAIEDSDPATSQRLVPVREAARGALNDVRDIARSLRPDVLDQLGLVPALQALTSRFARDTGIAVDRLLAGPPGKLSADAELVIYRIAQEALTNVARHADASAVAVHLAATEDSTVLTISDDGRGINGQDTSTAGGLRWMRERALLVDARLAVDTSAAGTTVSLHVPSDA